MLAIIQFCFCHPIPAVAAYWSHPDRRRQIQHLTRNTVSTAARLVAERGADMPVPKLLRVIAGDCPKMQAAQWHDVCEIHMPQLSELKW